MATDTALARRMRLAADRLLVALESSERNGRATGGLAPYVRNAVSVLDEAAAHLVPESTLPGLSDETCRRIAGQVNGRHPHPVHFDSETLELLGADDGDDSLAVNEKLHVVLDGPITAREVRRVLERWTGPWGNRPLERPPRLA